MATVFLQNSAFTWNYSVEEDPNDFQDWKTSGFVPHPPLTEDSYIFFEQIDSKNNIEIKI